MGSGQQMTKHDDQVPGIESPLHRRWMRRYGQCLRLYTQAYTPGLNQRTRFNHFPRLLWRIYERGVF